MRMVFGEGAEKIRNFNDLMKQFKGTAQSAGNAINEFEGSMDSAKVNTYEAQIKRLKQELAELANKGFSQYDPEYDSVAKNLQEVIYAKKAYDKELKSSIQAENESAKSTNNTANTLKNLKSVLSGASRLFSSIASGAIKAYKGVVTFLQRSQNHNKGIGFTYCNSRKIEKCIAWSAKAVRAKIWCSSDDRNVTSIFQRVWHDFWY